jgi:hypothetical protein
MPFLRAGEAASEFPEVASVDQLARGGVTAWWHGPVIAGCAAVNGQVFVPAGGQVKVPTPRVDQVLFKVVPFLALASRMR